MQNPDRTVFGQHGWMNQSNRNNHDYGGPKFHIIIVGIGTNIQVDSGGGGPGGGYR